MPRRYSAHVRQAPSDWHLNLYNSGANSQSMSVIESSSRVQPAQSSSATRLPADFDRDLETATLRADREKPPLGARLALANAPEGGPEYFKVPKVIER